jgi:putative component of toxin-antitoxin plasmid stabilization module
MFTVYQTQEFRDWLDATKDVRAQVRIAARLRLAEAGNLGDKSTQPRDIKRARGVSNDLDILPSKEDLVRSKRAAVMRNAGPGRC